MTSFYEDDEFLSVYEAVRIYKIVLIMVVMEILGTKLWFNLESISYVELNLVSSCYRYPERVKNKDF